MSSGLSTESWAFQPLPHAAWGLCIPVPVVPPELTQLLSLGSQHPAEGQHHHTQEINAFERMNRCVND
jgi:hypothetical protein